MESDPDSDSGDDTSSGDRVRRRQKQNSNDSKMSIKQEIVIEAELEDITKLVQFSQPPSPIKPNAAKKSTKQPRV